MARLQFAREGRNWTSEEWAKVPLSDESKFLLFGTDGIQYVHRPANKRFNPRFQIPMVKHGGGSVMA